jgi:membrane protease YdiL (CAAX protease family)
VRGTSLSKAPSMPQEEVESDNRSENRVTAPLDSLPSKPPVPDNDRALWAEIVAVVAVGVVPHLSNALFSAPTQSNQSDSAFWYDCLALTAHGLCISYVVLYLIYRSGEGWARFGLQRPRLLDLPLGVALCYVGLRLGGVYPELRGLDTGPQRNHVPIAKDQLDILLGVIAYLISAFSEELVTRAYLITRLEELLQSKWQAVILAAVAFASYHIYQDISGFIFSWLFGLVFGTAYLLVRRIWPLALGHALVNLFILWWRATH